MSGQIKRLDHVNVRTGQLDAMVRWYTEVLGMVSGKRPNFSFPGAWMYADGHPWVHLVGTDPEPSGGQEDLHLEHFAFAATGLKEMLARAEAAKARTMLRPVPGFPIIQLNIWDPDGNHLHVDFDIAEADGMQLD
ncbi:MAG: VOC family protein [Paracoccaceae bacterium]